ncbi:unnamed protein product [Gongylonema pulchrum]|uniref:Transposase n=1 Tax=Gongylonema pulchrum TaxID=637853 RepID=A0A183EJU7_9BILA|nr:unnamed protein product [Gongylonema pulchrum]
MSAIYDRPVPLGIKLWTQQWFFKQLPGGKPFVRHLNSLHDQITVEKFDFITSLSARGLYDTAVLLFITAPPPHHLKFLKQLLIHL